MTAERHVPQLLIGAALGAVWLAALYHFRAWLATGDIAIFQLRLEQLGNGEIPLAGAYSRVGLFHPGPLRDVLFWVPYSMSGARSAALPATQIVANIGAVWVVLRAAKQLGDSAALVAAAVGLGPLVVGMGDDFSSTWNPVAAILPAAAMVWGLMTFLRSNGRAWVVPVVAASLVGQLHMSGLIPAIAVLVTVAVMLVVEARRQHRWRRPVRAAAVAMLCWFGPIVDIIAHGSGANPFQLADAGDGDPLGLVGGARAVASMLSPWRVAAGEVLPPFAAGDYEAAPSGSLIVLVVAVAALALTAWMWRERPFGVASMVMLGMIALAIVTCTLIPAPTYRYLFAPIAGMLSVTTAVIVWSLATWLGSVSTAGFLRGAVVWPRAGRFGVPIAVAAVGVAGIGGWERPGPDSLTDLERSIPGAVVAATSAEGGYNVEPLGAVPTIAEADVALALTRAGRRARSDDFRLELDPAEPSWPTIIVATAARVDCVDSHVAGFTLHAMEPKTGEPLGIAVVSPDERAAIVAQCGVR